MSTSVNLFEFIGVTFNIALPELIFV